MANKEKPDQEKKKKKQEKPGDAAPAGEKPAKEGKGKPPVPIVPRLLRKYRDEIVPKMMQRFGYSSVQAVPKITKIVINSGVSRGEDSEKRLATVLKDMTLIAGQRPVSTKAKRSVAGFRVRAGDRVGAKVTLRRARMYEFLDRTISVAMPRVRDFRGLDPAAFDGCGNYNFGVSEQTVFPEVDIDSAEHFFGMDITIVTTAQTDEEGRALLEFFGAPFRQN